MSKWRLGSQRYWMHYTKLAKDYQTTAPRFTLPVELTAFETRRIGQTKSFSGSGRSHTRRFRKIFSRSRRCEQILRESLSGRSRRILENEEESKNARGNTRKIQRTAVSGSGFLGELLKPS